MDSSLSSSPSKSSNSAYELLLQQVQSNDPNRTSIGYYNEPDLDGVYGYGARLGQALTGNTYISKITLCLNDLLDPTIDSTNRSAVMQNLAPLLEYLQSSSSLESVTVVGGRRNLPDGYAAIQDVVYGALACQHGNPSDCHRQLDVTFASPRLPFHPFHRYLQESSLQSSMVSLTIEVSNITYGSHYDRNGSSRDYEALVAAAIAAHGSLQRLCLELPSALSIPPVLEMADTILMAILQHAKHSKLQTLELVPCTAGKIVRLLNSVPYIMLCPALTCLHTLKLSSCVIRDWYVFRPALQSRHIANIIFEGCAFDKGASRGLKQLLSRPSNNGRVTSDDTATAVAVAATRRVVKLSIRCPWHLLDYWQVKDQLTVPPKTRCLFETSQHSTIQIFELHLKVENEADLTTVTQDYLPKAVVLRRLTLRLEMSICGSDKNAAASKSTTHNGYRFRKHIQKLLLHGVRRNGSLHEFAVGEGRRQPSQDGVAHCRPILSQSLKRKVDACLERNRQLPDILSRRCLLPNVIAILPVTIRATGSTSTPVAVSMYPPLLVSASATPRMAPTHFLKGLSSRSQDGSLVLAQF